MKVNFKTYSLNSVIILIMALFFYSCSIKTSDVSTINFNEVAQGVGREVEIKHTDSGKLKLVLKAKVLKDYSHVDFPYYEFPKGVELTIFDEKGNQSKVFSDYAIQYSKTHLVDLQGNVKVITADSTVLKSEQLYWNQKLHWVYTDNPYNVEFKSGGKNKGLGFDANEDFTNFKSRTNQGIRILDN